MTAKRSLLPLVPLAFAAMVFGCTQKNTGDEPVPSNAPAGLERFLLFPNPIGQNTGGFETDTTEYAAAYYRAIDDPLHPKDTLARWMTENKFGSGTGAELRAVFRDVRDLGYGRNMNGRLNTDGSIAFYVENYNVGYTSTLNVDVAIARDKTWHVGTNAIEWSTTPCVPGVDLADCGVGSAANVKFAKFYNFSSVDGTRQLAIDLDGKGLKAMPGPCTTCHGGRGDPLTPGEGSPAKPRFPLVENSLSRKRGDVQGRLHGMNVDSFQFSTLPGWTRVDQEATLKTFNQWILCTYPLPAASPSDPTVDGCRVAAGAIEWQGTAAEMIKAWYGGTGTNGMPNTKFADNYVPNGWNTGTTIPNTTPPLTDQMLYREVVAPFCRTCHILRGTNNQSDLDFTTLGKFQGYGDRIKSHVFDRGTMPLALIVYNDFWNSSAPDTLASFVDSVPSAGKSTSPSGLALRPGRPIADPGPNRMVKSATSATLSAENSLFATTFQWSSSAVSIINPNSMIATFPPSPAGNYTVTLTVGNGTLTDSKDVVITVDNNFPDPATLKFAHVKNVLQNVVHKASAKCIDCHKDVATPAPINTPPIWYTNFDRNGSGGVADATDDDWFLKALQGRVNLTEIEASALLRKPSGHHHAGNDPIDLTTSAGLGNYSILYNWILAGMPAGGVAANPVVNGGVDPDVEIFSGAFGGPFTSPSIAMDGSQSIAPSGIVLTYSWSIASQPPGGSAVITNPTSATPTMTVQNVGDYVVQLQASGGGLTDTAQHKFTVGETPFTTDFTPADGGSGAVTFSGGRGDLVLTSATSVFATGNPVSCSWTVISGPGVLSPGIGALGGPTLDGSSSLVSTKACIQFITIFIPFPITFPVNASATLNVPSTALNNNYVVQFTASTVTSQTVTHTIKVAENPPVPSITVTSATSVGFSGNPPFASISLSGSSTGIAPFSFAWSIDSAPAGAVVASSITTGSTTSTLTARATGQYTVRLTVTDNAGGVGATTSTFTVTPSLGPTFSTIAGDFSSFGCTGCHIAANGNPANNSGTAPSWVTDGTNAGNVALWQRVLQRVILGASVNSSLLLLNPSNTDPGGHGGGCRPGFNSLGNAINTSPNFCPDTSATNYTAFRNWIVNGAAPGN